MIVVFFFFSFLYVSSSVRVQLSSANLNKCSKVVKSRSRSIQNALLGFVCQRLLTVHVIVNELSIFHDLTSPTGSSSLILLFRYAFP